MLHALKDHFLLKIAELLTPFEYPNPVGEWKNKVLRKAGLAIGKKTGIGRGFFFLHTLGGNITIGNYSILGHDCKMYSFNSIAIGDLCMFASDVSLTNGSHEVDNLVPFSAPLVIGNGCWFGTGAKVVVTKKGGLTIGDHAIIGAGALVIDNVPPCAVVAGVPAKVLRYRDLPETVWHLGSSFNPHTLETTDRPSKNSSP